MNDNSIMHEGTWTKDGEQGCLMSLIKVGAAALVLAIVTVVAITFGAPALVNLWWG